MFDPQQLAIPSYNNQQQPPPQLQQLGDDFKTAKDALITSLFGLSKAANDASKAALDFFDAVDQKPQYLGPPPTNIFDQQIPLTQTNSGPQQVQVDEQAQAQAQAQAAAQAHHQHQQHQHQTQQQHLHQQQQQSPAQQQSPSQQQSPPQAAPEKKKKKLRDPNAPKKPLTSFFLYSNYMREQIVSERARSGLSQLSQPEIAQETSRRWKEIPDTEKARWKDLYETEKVKYEEENKRYLLAKEQGASYTAPKRTEGLVPEHIKKEEKKKLKKKKKQQQQQQQAQLQQQM